MCRKLLDQWNKHENDRDSPARGVWYNMGSELLGATTSLDGRTYKWSCLAEVKLDLTKALSREVETGDAAEQCVLCWLEMYAHSQC